MSEYPILKVDNRTGSVIVDEDVEIDENRDEVVFKKKDKKCKCDGCKCQINDVKE